MTINFRNKNVRYKIYCYILHTVLSVIILLFIIAIICYYYSKQQNKTKSFALLTISKWRIMNFKKLVLKVVRVIISMRQLNSRVLILIIFYWIENYTKIF